MKISEVMQECDALYENNVSQAQKIKWCDELGETLKKQYAKHYCKEKLEKTGADFIIPEGIDASRILSVIADGHGFTVREFLRQGGLILPGKVTGAGRFCDLVILYQEPYTPIRDIRTDETVADAPYDRMYIDYLIAKLNYYNRDFEGYNQHMNYFNNVLSEYAADFIRTHQPPKREIVGWW